MFSDCVKKLKWEQKLVAVYKVGYRLEVQKEDSYS